MSVFWPNKISNARLLHATGQEAMGAGVILWWRRWKRLCYVLRMEPTVYARTALTWTLEGRRKSGVWGVLILVGREPQDYPKTVRSGGTSLRPCVPPGITRLGESGARDLFRCLLCWDATTTFTNAKRLLTLCVFLSHSETLHCENKIDQ